MASIIQVSGLSKQFNEIKAVDELSFSVNEGDVYAFLGQNGAGKSTTIRMLLTLIAPSAGKIEIFGMDLTTKRKEILRQVGAVIERPDLYNYLSAYDNISLFARMSGVKVAKKRLMDQLDIVGLSERAHSKVKTFSQGMKQRLGIAVALVHDPRLIILDEPTNGLDPQGIADVRNLILDLGRNQKKTILISSHLLNEVEQMASRLLIIDKGRKMVEGSALDFFNPAKMMLEIQTLDPDAVLNIIRSSKWSGMLQRREKDRFIFEINKMNIPALVEDLSQKGVQLLLVQPRHSLEDYFFSLTTPNLHVDSFAICIVLDL